MSAVRNVSPRIDIESRVFRPPSSNSRLRVTPSSRSNRPPVSPAPIPVPPPVIPETVSNGNGNLINIAMTLKLPTRPNYSVMSESEQRDKRALFISKFDLLKRSYVKDLPEFPLNISLDGLHDLYESYVKQVTIGIKCREWKLIIGLLFPLVEMGISYFIIDVKGISKNQKLILDLIEPVMAEFADNYLFNNTGIWSPQWRMAIVGGFVLCGYAMMKFFGKKVGIKDEVINSWLSNLTSYLFGVAPKEISEIQGIPNIPQAGANVSSNPIMNIISNIGGAAGAAGAAGGGGGGMDFGSILSGIMGAIGQQSRPAPDTSRPPRARRGY